MTDCLTRICMVLYSTASGEPLRPLDLNETGRISSYRLDWMRSPGSSALKDAILHFIYLLTCRQHQLQYADPVR